MAKFIGQKIRWPKPKPINEKLWLRPINRLICRPLVCCKIEHLSNIDEIYGEMRVSEIKNCQKYCIFKKSLATFWIYQLIRTAIPLGLDWLAAWLAGRAKNEMVPSAGCHAPLRSGYPTFSCITNKLVCKESTFI